MVRMKQLRRLPWMMPFACLAVNVALAQADEKTLRHLQAYRSALVNSVLQKTPEKMQGYYADDLRLMPEFQKTITGKRHALLYQQAFERRFDAEGYSRTEDEVLDLGQRVVETGSFVSTVKDRSTGKRHRMQGKYLDLWKKEGDSVQLITQAWNYNHALGMEDRLRFAELPVTDVAVGAHLPVNTSLRFELAALNRLMEITITQHDAALWGQFYADDAAFLYSRTPPQKGKKVLDSFLVAHTRDLPVFEGLHCRTNRVDDIGTCVIEYASHVAFVRNGGFSAVATGKDLRIWRREKAGPLKIFRHIAMYD